MDFRDILRYLVWYYGISGSFRCPWKSKKNAGSLCHDYNIHSISLVTVHCISIFLLVGFFLAEVAAATAVC